MSTGLRDAPIVFATDGGIAQRLPISVRELILAADRRSQATGIPTAEAVDAELRAAIANAGITLTPTRLKEAVQSLNAMRKARPIDSWRFT